MRPPPGRSIATSCLIHATLSSSDGETFQIEKAHLAVGYFSSVHGGRLLPASPMASNLIIAPGKDMSNKLLIDAVRSSLSSARMATYERAAGAADDEDLSALKLYAWNAQVSAAMLAPIHLCEVVIRNAVSEALESVYGSRWPWEPVFIQSLPDPQKDYSPRKDLVRASRSVHTIGKVIPELKFVFWQKMFTKRHDVRLWNPHLKRVMPNLDPAKSANQLRLEIYNHLEHIRILRNRIAHHEPVFQRALLDDLSRISGLIQYRCTLTKDWMFNNQQASSFIANKP